MAGELSTVGPARPLVMGWLVRGFNGAMRRARKGKGMSQAALARVLGTHVTTIGNIELLKQRPGPGLRENIADFLGLNVQEVWPDWLEPRNEAITAEVYREVTPETYSMLDQNIRKEVLQLKSAEPPPEESADREFIRERVGQVLRTLTDLERGILELRHGLGEGGHCYTIDECARIFKVTRERVRQIEIKALAKLGKGPRAEHLAAAADLLICPACKRSCGMTRFCHGCGLPGCGHCRNRVHKDGKYVYLCERCCRRP
jgi:RNA polymerase sigma factor (sigma-70 family)